MGYALFVLVVGILLTWVLIPVVRNPSSLDKRSLLYKSIRRATFSVPGRRELGTEPRPDEIRFWAIMFLVVAVGLMIAGLVGIFFPTPTR